MRKTFLTGLITLLPLAITLWVVVFVVRFLTKPFIGLMTQFVSELPPDGLLRTEHGIRILSEILILLGLFVFTLALGLVARRLFFHHLLKWGDQFLYQIPLVNKVYKTSKEIIRALFASKKGSFQQVVLIPFPHKGCYCLGLIANDAPHTCCTKAGEEMVSVFIPTTPTPMSGYVAMVPKKEVIPLKMKSEEAIKYIVSCAVIQPGSTS